LLRNWRDTDRVRWRIYFFRSSPHCTIYLNTEAIPYTLQMSGKSVSHLFQGPSPPNRLLRLWSQFRMTRAISYINDPLSVLRMVFHRRHPVLVPLRLLSIHKIPL